MSSSGDSVVGLGACLVSVFCFGSMFVALRRFQPGDGFFVQWVLCSGIFFAGTLCFLLRGAPPFQPLAMLGGVLWGCGECSCSPVPAQAT